MISFRSIILISLALTIIACSSPSKLYDKGNYQKAFTKALSELEKGKKNRENKKIINDAFDKIMNEDEEEIIALKNGNLEDQEKAYNQYGNIFKSYNSAKKYLGNDIDIRVEKLKNDRNILGDKLANDYASVAKRNLNEAIDKNNKLLAQTAYYQFDKAIYYAEQENKELSNLQQDALDLGVVHYLITKRSINFDLSWEIDRVFEDVEKDVKNIFTKVSYDKSSENTDCIIDLVFSDFEQFDRTRTDRRDFEEEVITGYQTQVDTSGTTTEIPIYERVTGSVRIDEVTRTSELELRLDIYSNNGNCQIRRQRFDASFDENLEFYTAYGDERAIPARFRNTRNQDFENPNRVAEDLLDEIYRDFLDNFR